VERKIVLEITEHLPVASYTELMEALADLRTRVRLAVDDAGSGYAGLQHLLEIKPDIMKLDIALVRTVDHDPGRHALIASMITFARETDCIVLAEGIETSEELEALCALGVDLGQGYLLGRPARIESLVAPDALALEARKAA
jgi:EAL domain-containing protein (putative c-di-GMP-specific phosphodiesterase class I)